MNATRTMSTNQATAILAEIEASGGYGSSEPDRCLLRARDAGRAWQWDHATHALADAYRSLGAEPPPGATGYDWHCGHHPIQIEASHRKDRTDGRNI